MYIDLSRFNAKIPLTAPIEQHAEWIMENFYAIPYPDGKKREIHGKLHIGRVGMLTTVRVNHRRRWGDQEALKITPEELKILTILAFWHDAARVDEGKDDTRESAELAYYYLTLMMDIPPVKRVFMLNI